MNKAISVVLMMFAVLTAFAQSSNSSENSGRPDIPGTLRMDFGYSINTNGDSTLSVFGSRTFNVYYQREFQLGESKFSFVPGLGFGFDRLKFKDYENGFGRGLATNADSTYFMALSEIKVVKSMLVSNYIDVPVEFVFTSNPENEAKSFKAAVGFKVGYRFATYTKLKYNENEETKKMKDYQNFHVSPLRYGPYVRLGFGGFNVFANYTLTPVFNEGEGPVDLNMMTVGISWPAF